jgi:hypothetical protein
MAITLRTLDTNASIIQQQITIQQVEQLGFRLLTLTTGRVGGGRANLVTFIQTSGAPATAITLEVVNGAMDQDAQETILNVAGRQLVCYGSLFVQAMSENIAAWRN